LNGYSNGQLLVVENGNVVSSLSADGDVDKFISENA